MQDRLRLKRQAEERQLELKSATKKLEECIADAQDISFAKDQFTGEDIKKIRQYNAVQDAQLELNRLMVKNMAEAASVNISLHCETSPIIKAYATITTLFSLKKLLWAVLVGAITITAWFYQHAPLVQDKPAKVSK